MLFPIDRKSTRLNSSHLVISYAVFCLKKKTNTILTAPARRRGCGPAPAQHREAPPRRSRPCGRSAALPSPSLVFFFFFFFFNKPAPPKFSLFPLPAVLPT